MLTQLFELSWKDSNPHRRNQNPTCYHYTTRQSVCKTFFSLALMPYSFYECKGIMFFYYDQIF